MAGQQSGGATEAAVAEGPPAAAAAHLKSLSRDAIFSRIRLSVTDAMAAAGGGGAGWSSAGRAGGGEAALAAAAAAGGALSGSQGVSWRPPAITGH